MNLYLTSTLNSDEIFAKIEEHLKIHNKVTVYYKGRLFGTFTAPSTQTFITNKTYPTLNGENVINGTKDREPAQAQTTQEDQTTS